MQSWTLKAAAEKRFHSGHPWVFSNELAHSPKGLEPGALVELKSQKGSFLAYGYGNPGSLISFRTLTRHASENPSGPDFLLNRLQRALALRMKLGLIDQSFRLIHGEADYLPGLVLDRYLLEGKRSQVFSIQAHTAGIEKWVPTLIQALERFSATDLKVEHTGILIRGNASARKLEGLEKTETQVIRSLSEDLTTAKVLVPETIEADLINGQKTGLFLDQRMNAALLATLATKEKAVSPARVLDLFCHMGQWGVKLGQALKGNLEVTACDASAEALARTTRNLKGIPHQVMESDLLESLPRMPAKQYDIVICDPPGLIKSRKVIPQGKHAYLQLNTHALRVAKPGALIATSSCSGLLTETDFAEILAKAARRAEVNVQWIYRESQAPDHPVLAEFPEGRYLKCWIGRIVE